MDSKILFFSWVLENAHRKHPTKWLCFFSSLVVFLYKMVLEFFGFRQRFQEAPQTILQNGFCFFTSSWSLVADTEKDPTKWFLFFFIFGEDTYRMAFGILRSRWILHNFSPFALRRLKSHSVEAKLPYCSEGGLVTLRNGYPNPTGLIHMGIVLLCWTFFVTWVKAVAPLNWCCFPLIFDHFSSRLFEHLTSFSINILKIG